MVPVTGFLHQREQPRGRALVGIRAWLRNKYRIPFRHFPCGSSYVFVLFNTSSNPLFPPHACCCCWPVGVRGLLLIAAAAAALGENILSKCLRYSTSCDGRRISLLAPQYECLRHASISKEQAALALTGEQVLPPSRAQQHQPQQGLPGRKVQATGLISAGLWV